jgi:hypothetical protein
MNTTKPEFTKEHCAKALQQVMESTILRMNPRFIHQTRYFISDTFDMEEVTEEEFGEAEGETTTERHTVFANGVNQTCHTKAVT